MWDTPGLTTEEKGRSCALLAQVFPPAALLPGRPTVPSTRSGAGGPAFGAPNPPSLPPGDETYLDIFRDFSLMASDDPEKLSRRAQDLHTL